MTSSQRDDHTPHPKAVSGLDNDDNDRVMPATSRPMTRRRVLHWSLLGITGGSLAAVMTGCGWGDVEDDEIGDSDGGLTGGEDPGENPGIEDETGIENPIDEEDRELDEDEN